MKLILENGREIEVKKVRGRYESLEEVREEEIGERVKIEEEGKVEERKGIKGEIEKINGRWMILIREKSRVEIEEERRKKQSKRQNEWIKGRYDRIGVAMVKGKKERIEATGKSVNGFINEAVDKLLEEYGV